MSSLMYYKQLNCLVDGLVFGHSMSGLTRVLESWKSPGILFFLSKALKRHGKGNFVGKSLKSHGFSHCHVPCVFFLKRENINFYLQFFRFRKLFPYLDIARIKLLAHNPLIAQGTSLLYG